jgi:hypothetical protein
MPKHAACLPGKSCNNDRSRRVVSLEAVRVAVAAAEAIRDGKVIEIDA